MAYFIDGIQYDEAEYQEIRKIINSRPADTFETVHRFNHEKKMIEGYERTEEEKVQWYVQLVEAGTITIGDVPEDYREAVQAQLPEEANNDYGVDNDTFNAIIDDYTVSLMEMGLI